ncbi:MAG: YtxH domain-containing protein [Candidatus Paralactobacillus gallistercoris]|uniref:YtxH domain-containing protein n=1 Tax=Candidatus Paralactobacillus gallistercoris TaxID=2838724 RepID=A0A948TIY3_9LACO|nr:YtxH domain-containing protein [Candidatus Paralactobacillus gallistercoris]
MAKKNHFFLGFILGGMSALAATYLMAPETGDELKNKITGKAHDLKDRALDYYNEISEAADEASKEVAEAGDEAKENIDEVTNDIDNELNEAGDTMRDDMDKDDFDNIVIDGKSAFGEAKDHDGSAVAEELTEAQKANKPAAAEEVKTEEDVTKAQIADDDKDPFNKF